MAGEAEDARPSRADRPAGRARRAARRLPLPAGAGRQGGGAPAEFPRRAARRFAQHADRRSRRGAARRRSCARSSAPPDRGVLKALSDKFMVRTFRFSTAASRVDAEDELTFTGAQTRLGVALDGARQELAGLPLAGLVVVSDGADTAEGALGESLLALKSQGVPVFTVGVGQETLSRDIQIGRVSTPRVALKGHDADDRRDHQPDRLRRKDGRARRRGRRPDRRIAAGEAAGRWIGGDGARAVQRVAIPGRACSASRSRRRTASSSPRTTFARR